MADESASPSAKIRCATAEPIASARQTGTRPRQEMRTPRWGEALAPEPVEPENSRSRALHPSVAPESLRVPYSSLTSTAPNRRSPSFAPGVLSTPSTSETAPPSLGRKIRQANTTCLIHGIARGPKGRCLLCDKKATPPQREGWRLLLALMALALAIALMLATTR